mgnify:CR=1 FL=1
MAFVAFALTACFCGAFVDEAFPLAAGFLEEVLGVAFALTGFDVVVGSAAALRL